MDRYVAVNCEVEPVNEFGVMLADEFEEDGAVHCDPGKEWDVPKVNKIGMTSVDEFGVIEKLTREKYVEKVMNEFGAMLMGEFGVVEEDVVKMKFVAKMGETKIVVESVNVLGVMYMGELEVVKEMPREKYAAMVRETRVAEEWTNEAEFANTSVVMLRKSSGSSWSWP